jgi:hypothetical protein
VGDHWRIPAVVCFCNFLRFESIFKSDFGDGGVCIELPTARGISVLACSINNIFRDSDILGLLGMLD